MNHGKDCHSVELIYLFLYYNLRVKLKFMEGLIWHASVRT